MPRTGSIGGIVTDEYGEPLFNVRVQAFRVGGETREAVAGSDTTDDLGVYRIGRLPPGEYIVSFQAPHWRMAEAEARGRQQQAIREAIERELAARNGTVPGTARVKDVFKEVASARGVESEGAARHYYPAAESSAEAMPIRVAVRQDVIGVDVQIATKARR